MWSLKVAEPRDHIAVMAGCCDAIETSGLRNHACVQAQTKCDAGTEEYQENVREAEKQLTHNSNEPVRQTNSIYIYSILQFCMGGDKCQGWNVYFFLAVTSVSCRYSIKTWNNLCDLEVRAGTFSLYVTLMFYLELYNHTILEVVQVTCNLDLS